MTVYLLVDFFNLCFFFVLRYDFSHFIEEGIPFEELDVQFTGNYLVKDLDDQIFKEGTTFHTIGSHVDTAKRYFFEVPLKLIN